MSKTGGGSMITEFGAVGTPPWRMCSPTAAGWLTHACCACCACCACGVAGHGQASADTISKVADLADTHLQSWAYWTFKSFHDITTQV